MRKAREGGAAVAAAVAAAAMTGKDANEIELPDDDDDDDAVATAKGTEPGQEHDAVIDAGGWGGSDDEAEDEDADEAAKMEANAEALDASRALRKSQTRRGSGKGRRFERASRDEDRDGVDFEKKPRRVFTGSGASLFIRRWAWKREAKSDEERFSQPYAHEMQVRAGSAVPMDSTPTTATVPRAPSPCVSRSAGSATAARTAGSRPRCGTRPSCWPSTSSGTKKNSEAFARVRTRRGVRRRLRRARRRRRVARRRHGPPGESPAVTREPPRQLRRGRLRVTRGTSDRWRGGRTRRPRSAAKNSTSSSPRTACTWKKPRGRWWTPSRRSWATSGWRGARRGILPGRRSSRTEETERRRRRSRGARRGRAASGRDVTLRATDVREEDLDELYQCSDVRVVHYAAERAA